MRIEEYIDKLYIAAEKSGADEFQIIYDYIASESWSLLEGELETKKNNENQSISVKLKKDGKIGRCTSRNLKEAAIPEVIASAMENAELIDKAEEDFFYDGKGHYANVEPYHPIADKMAILNPLAFMKEVEKEVLKADKRILSNPKISLNKSKRKKIIRNSLGLNLQNEQDGAFCFVSVIAQDGDSKENKYEEICFDKEEDFNPVNIAQKVVKNAVSHLHGIRPQSGPAKVVFAPKSLTDILFYMGYCTSAEKIEKKQSKFVGKLGEVVASPLLTIIEDPLQKGGYDTIAFDNEGVPTNKKEIISKGVLQTYLYNLKTAHHAGVKPTGNGSDNMTGVALNNLYIKAGDVSKEELLKTVKDGVYVDAESGFWQGLGLSSGDFSFSASGFLIEDGKIGQPLEQFTVAGNFYQMLKDIKMIANDLEFDPSGISTPTIFVEGLTVGGK